MKRQLRLFLYSLVLICTLATAPVYISGCAGGPNRVAYQSVGTTKVTISTAMSLWGAYVTQQKLAGTPVPVDREQAVASAYSRVQASLVIVCDAGKALSAGSQTNPAGVSALQAALSQAITDSASTIADLQNLIVSFGVKLQ